MIRNFYNCDKEVDNNSHDGVGSIDIYRAFRRKDFDGA
ncbi:cupin domain-containing protein, partial [Vibrio sp. 10N.261.49.A5]